jgi:hypothetical protein
MKNAYETQLLQLISQQKKQVEILKTTLEVTDKRCLLVNRTFSICVAPFLDCFIGILVISRT